MDLEVRRHLNGWVLKDLWATDLQEATAMTNEDVVGELLNDWVLETSIDTSP